MTRAVRYRPIALLVGALLPAFALPAAVAADTATDDEEVLQIKQAFDPKAITVAAGVAVRFVNGDDVKHNLQAVAPDGSRTDYGVAPPGQTTPITFAAPGEYSVVCGIHPRMKLKVTVHP